MSILYRVLPCLLAASSAIAQSRGPAITFYQHIAPVVYRECAPCHRPGESAPFPLLSYEDVKRHAATIAKVTKSRYMPPWLPQAGYGEFTEQRRLTDREIKLIQDWVAQGSPAGSAANAPAPPKFTTEWQYGKPDLVLRVTQPYKLAASGKEVFWNFILPVPVTSSKWVKAVEVRPGNARAFHHANIVLDRSRGARRHEVAPGAGFPGMNLVFEEETFDPDGHFLSWKPGSEPVVEPDGMAWRADPGMDMVLNVHLRPTGKEEVVAPMIGLYFTDKPQTRFPMLVQLEHDSTIDIPAGNRDFVVSDDFRCPMDVNVLAVYPHAHYLAKLMEAYATLPDGTKKWLIRIPDWDLSWQGVFRFKRPVALPKGATISMRYHYDNSAENPRNPNSPPVRVTAGNEATQEMGHFWLQVLPAADGDQRAALQESIVRQKLAKYPDDFGANYNMGDLLLSRGDAPGAIPYFEKAAAADPTSVFAATDLGVALFTAQKLPEGEAQFKRALTLDPHYTDARFDLASEEAASGQFGPAAADFRQVMAERPDHAKARQHLGEVYILWGDQLAKGGKDDEAAARYRDAVVIRPDDVDLHIRLGMTLARMEHLRDSQKEFETVLRLQPNSTLARQAIDAIQARMKATGKQ